MSISAGAAPVPRPREASREAAPLADTEGAQSPFFSPDGQWIAFFAEGKLERVSVTGGATVVLADAPFDRGGSWSDDGTIFFAPFSASGVGLSRVSWSGGATEVLTTPDPAAGESTHRWTQALPGGKAVLFTAMNRNAVATYDEASLVAQRLPSGPRKVVVPGGYHGRYLPSGHVVFLHGDTLFAVPFDLERLEATGPSVPVIDELVGAPYTAGAQFPSSDRGTLAYLPGHSLPEMRGRPAITDHDDALGRNAPRAVRDPVTFGRGREGSSSSRRAPASRSRSPKAYANSCIRTLSDLYLGDGLR